MEHDQLASEGDTSAVVVRQGGGAIEIRDERWQPSPLALLSEEDFNRRIQVATLEVERLQKIQWAIMQEDVDYGKIPGVDKPALFQPGAQKLCRFAGFVPQYTPTKTIGDGIESPVISYEIRCQLIDQAGTTMGEGFGAANSWETKHRYRYNDKTCPECGAAAIRRSQAQYGGGYYCATNKGGCNEKFKSPEAVAAFDAQPNKIQNPDQHDLDNTLLKMGCKRAFVAAVVQAFACSGQFSQDAPEMPGANERGDEADNRAAQSRPPAQGDSAPASVPNDGDPVSDAQVRLLHAKMKQRFQELNYLESDMEAAIIVLLTNYGCERFEDLTKPQVSPVLRAIEAFN
jgi:hypothetical protein